MLHRDCQWSHDRHWIFGFVVVMGNHVFFIFLRKPRNRLETRINFANQDVKRLTFNLQSVWSESSRDSGNKIGAGNGCPRALTCRRVNKRLYFVAAREIYTRANANSDRREGALRRKRVEYLDCVGQFYDIPDTERTVPDVAFFQQAQVQKSMERILYTWAIRHPASGYVQGINDLVTPFLVVFLSEYFGGSIDSWSMSDMPFEKISDIEADCYWCLSKLLDGMKDHYTFAQPGIQRLVFKLKELFRRIDEPVYRHMEDQALEYLQFAFRWFNWLLIREKEQHFATFPFSADKLLCYTNLGVSIGYVNTDKLQKLDFQEMVFFLQRLPTQNWTCQELETVLSRAYVWHSMFNKSPSHLAS
ncbi:Detected protein of confused Function [Hibiscus syriacus]|uniref:Detected protein of confused Function n=1 Tax=Hibiscus syriacus TaxID=106335 RepID=A0A6A2XCX0_HIBSY|nr:Detected protein of confused Function [Hibiscus syriacus]